MQYHHIKIHIHTKENPPYFIGSMARGAFGHALKRVSCINPSYLCEGCFDAKNCLYYDFFEKQNVPLPFRTDIVLGNDAFEFGFYLFGEACGKLPYVLSSIEKALTHNGLGKDRKTYDNIDICVNGKRVYEKNAFLSHVNIDPQTVTPVGKAPLKLKIKLLTPLRMKVNNKIEYKKIKIEHIVRSINERMRYIFEHIVERTLLYDVSYMTSIEILEYKPLYRKSSRQGGSSVLMDGVTGEIAVIGLDQKSYELLKIGEVVGVGKQTVFGLGKIQIEEVE